MKKWLLFLSVVLAVSACGNASDNTENNTDASSTTIEAQDAKANEMDDIQAEIEAKRAELEEAVNAIEEDEN